MICICTYTYMYIYIYVCSIHMAHVFVHVYTHVYINKELTVGEPVVQRRRCRNVNCAYIPLSQETQWLLKHKMHHVITLYTDSPSPQ